MPSSPLQPPTENLRPLRWVLLAAAGTFALTMGTRQSMGLFVGDVNTSTGLGLASVSLAFAFGQLCWGLTQPFAGWVADRHGPGRVLVLGVLLVASGLLLVPFMHSTVGLIFAIGVLAAGGAGMAGPSVLMSATTRLVALEKRGLATGVVNAGGSFGQFVFAPVATAISTAAGWAAAVAIGWAIGFQGGRWRMKSLLALIYAIRAVAVLLFVGAPKSTAVMLLFAAVMGVTFLSTVPPTAGLVARFFGSAHMGTLFGLVMVTHQIGGFLGAWLGGKAFEATGNYDAMWYADILLAVAAALLHLSIKEAAKTPALARV